MCRGRSCVVLLLLSPKNILKRGSRSDGRNILGGVCWCKVGVIASVVPEKFSGMGRGGDMGLSPGPYIAATMIPPESNRVSDVPSRPPCAGVSEANTLQNPTIQKLCGKGFGRRCRIIVCDVARTAGT